MTIISEDENANKPPPTFVHRIFCPTTDSPTQATVGKMAADPAVLADAPPGRRLSVIQYQVVALEQQRWTREMCGVAWDGDDGQGGLKHAPGDIGGGGGVGSGVGAVQSGGSEEDAVGGNSPGTVLWEALFRMRMRSMALVRLYHGSNRSVHPSPCPFQGDTDSPAPSLVGAIRRDDLLTS